MRSLENVFRIGAALRTKAVKNIHLKNWIEETPELTRSSYEAIPWRNLALVYAEDALTETQRSEKWELPDWNTFKRHVRQYPPATASMTRMEDFLFIAGALMKQLEWNSSPDARVLYAKRAMYQLQPDIDAIRKRIQAEHRRLEKLDDEGIFPERSDFRRTKGSKSLRFARICKELADRLPVQERFVPLTLITEGRLPEGAFGEIKDSYQEFLEAADGSDRPLIVLLGDPGSGKTTLMRRLYSQKLREFKDYEDRPVPFLIALGSSNWEKSLDPEKLVSEAWKRDYGSELCSFEEMASAGKVMLLLDGFNEGARPGVAATWKAYLRESFLAIHGNRVVMSCRTTDYGLPLALEGIYAPHFQIAPLDPKGIARYLDLTIPQSGKLLLNIILGNSELTTLYGSPFFLSALVKDWVAGKAVNASKIQLLSRIVWGRCHEEYGRAELAFSEPLFTQSDRDRIANSTTFGSTTNLPDHGTFIPFLSDLAFAMGNNTSILVDEVEQFVPQSPLADAHQHIKIACSTALLTLDYQDWRVSFRHQLIQEFFAAHRIETEANDDSFWKVPWRKNELLDFKPKDNEEQLPSLPSTGWEEATIMAAGLSQDQETLVSRIFKTNPLLAARCINAPGVEVSTTLRALIQDHMLELKHSEEADFRTRLAAGLLITEMGLLGYQQRTVPAPCLIPPFVQIEGGNYAVGAPAEVSEGLKGHAHQLVLEQSLARIDSFAMASYHVTNAEFKLFLSAGGYENLEWWPEGAAQNWLNREGFFGDLLRQLEVDIETDRKWGRDYIQSQIGRRWNSKTGLHKIAMLDWTAEERENWVREEIDRIGDPRFPGYWFNSDFNAPTQPVVAVSWYEATAYCRWLSALTGDLYRLPTELEYEVVARGLTGQGVPYGEDPDPSKSNIRTSGIWRPTPVGLYPGGAFQKIHDLIGNVWTWTTSFDPPEDASDQARRVTRGGSYDTSPELAKAYFRDSNHPGNRNRYDGFRLVRETQIPDQHASG